MIGRYSNVHLQIERECECVRDRVRMKETGRTDRQTERQKENLNVIGPKKD